MLDFAVISKFISASRVVHRLPGRLRIHIPILEKLPSGWLSFSEHTAELIKMKNGVEKVKIQPVTGSLLIHYNPEQVEETDIMKWLKTIVETFLKIDTPSNSTNKADISRRFERMRDWFNQDSAAPYIN